MQHFQLPYGVLEVTNGGVLEEIKEKPEYDFLVNTGMYIVNKDTLKLIPKGKLFHMTNLIGAVKKDKGKVGVFPVRSKAWIDIGQWEAYRTAMKDLGV